VSDWYYSSGAERSGPVAEEEMQRLAQTGAIRADTLCWRSEFGSEWRPFAKTDLFTAPAIDASMPPPLPPSHISNVYAWLFAFVPLVGAIVETALDQAGVNVPPPAMLLSYAVAYLVLVSLDSAAIKRSGNPDVNHAPSALWFLIAPVYLWKRGTFLRQGRAYFWVWVACFVVGVAVDIASASQPTLSTHSVKVVKMDDGVLVVTSLVDNIEIRSLSINHGNCTFNHIGYAFPHPLKFGDTLTAIAACDPIEVTIETDRGSPSFTWAQ